MINLRNEGDFPIFLQILGTLTTTAGLTEATLTRPTTATQGSCDCSQPIPFNGVIKAVWGYERIAGSSAAGTPGDCVDLLYFPPLLTTASGVQSTVGISFCQPTPPTATATCMFNMASSTIGGTTTVPLYFGQVPLVTFANATQGGYGAIYTSTTQFNPPQVARGGILVAACRTVAATPGVDFSVIVEIARQRQGAYIDAVQIGTYGADSDIY